MKSHQTSGSESGFTLVELLVGVAVSGLVALFLFWMVAQDTRFKALERARASVRDKVQLSIDLFQEDFRGIESTSGLEARPGSFYVQSDKGLLTLDWGVRFKRWLYLSEGGRPGFQPLWVVWGGKKSPGSGSSSWTLYRIVQREAYGQKIEVSRLELKPLTRAKLHLFGLNKRAEPGPSALVRLDKVYPYSIPSSELERLVYAELEVEALAQTGASQRMLGTFGQNYRPYRFLARAQPKNIDAAFVDPKPLSGVSLPPPQAENDAMDRVDYIVEGVKTVTIEALKAGLQVIQLAATLITAVSAPTAAVGVAGGAGTAAVGVAAGAGTTVAGAAVGTGVAAAGTAAGAVTAVPTVGVGAVAGVGGGVAVGAGTAAAGAAVGTGAAAAGVGAGTAIAGAGGLGGVGGLGGLALSSATNLIIPIVETIMDKLLDWLIKPVLRATTTPGVVAYCEAALSNPIGQAASGGGSGATGAGAAQGGGIGIGGTPPGQGGPSPNVQALEEINALSNGPSAGNRFGVEGRGAGPIRGDFLPGQSQGQGFAFGRVSKTSQGNAENSVEGRAGQESATQSPAGGSEESSGGAEEGSGTWSATFTQEIETSPWKEAWLLPKGFFVAKYEGYLSNALEINPAGLLQQATKAGGSQPLAGGTGAGAPQGTGAPKGVGIGIGGVPPGQVQESRQNKGDVPRGFGIGIGGVPPGQGGPSPNVQALEEINALSNGPSAGNRFGVKGRGAGPSQGDFLPGQSQGQGFAFGRVSKAQKTSVSPEQQKTGQKQEEKPKRGAQKKQEGTPQGLKNISQLSSGPSDASNTTGIRFIPESQNPYLALLGLPLNAGLDENSQATLRFEGETFASQDWGKVFVFSPYFIPGQSTPTHPLPVNKGGPFDIQTLNSMDNVTVGDVLAALIAALPISRNAYVPTLPFLKLLRTTAEGINTLVQTLGQATSLVGGGQSGTGAAQTGSSS